MNGNSTEIFFQIVMDIGYPMSVGNLQHILNALKNILVIGCSQLNHGEPVFCFGISFINEVFQSFAPFEEKRKSATTMSILKEFENMVRMRSKLQVTAEEYSDMIHLAIKSSIEEYNSKRRLFKFRHGNKSSLEILIVTRKCSYDFNLCIGKVSDIFHKNDLKKIQILKLIENDSEEDGEIDSADNDNSQLIKNVKVRIDSELDNNMKKCIFDSYYKLGEMVLYMPNKTIYCDITSYVINSDNFKFDSSQVKLEVVNRLSAEGLSESHIYGFAMRVTPSSNAVALKLLPNKQTFNALCQHLNETEEYLVVRQKRTTSYSTYDYFFLRPGVDCMLMKPLCSGEMILPDPMQYGSTDEERSLQEYWEVANSLKHIARVEEYKPNHFLSGFLTSQQSQPATASKPVSAITKQRNQYKKLEILMKKPTSQNKIECESPTIVSQENTGEPTPKKRMLLPLDAKALVNIETYID